MKKGKNEEKHVTKHGVKDQLYSVFFYIIIFYKIMQINMNITSEKQK